ncbi:hypothetical protein U9M48_016830 [Paspalum notatum var. saurae]|uniref:Uncharacterized protein n=1 Tax=Paspalum notatum var. saurae TaxID=547442 RepID=A0AAQ3T7G3_PASNO
MAAGLQRAALDDHPSGPGTRGRPLAGSPDSSFQICCPHDNRTSTQPYEMQPFEEHTDEVDMWDGNQPLLPQVSMDFRDERRMSTSNHKGAAFAGASSCVGRVIGPRAPLQDLDLNSEALHLDCGMTFSQLLRSPPHAGNENAKSALIREAGGPLRANNNGRVSSTAAAAGTVVGGGVGHRGGTSHGAAPSRSRPLGTPATTTARPYRPPRPSGRAGRGGGGRRGSREGPYHDAAGPNEADEADNAAVGQESTKAGNAPNGFMSSRGYKNISDKFYMRLGLRHSKLQFKNRWDTLRGLYGFWLWANKQSGLGRTPTGGIVASAEWWKKYTKGHGEWRKLKNGPPECLEDLQIMFQHIVVDGSASCVPGEYIGDDNNRDDDSGDELVGDGSPVGNTAVKRGASSTATSPKKRIRSPMVKIMKGMLDTMQANSVATQNKERSQSIKDCMQLVVECGAKEGSPEHFMATKLLNEFHWTDEEDNEDAKLACTQFGTMQEAAAIACMFGTYYTANFMNKRMKLRSGFFGIEWVMMTLHDPRDCFNMFRMTSDVFHRLHDVLVSKYGLKSTKRMSSLESLAMFLWMVGAPQSVRQAENRFERSPETISRKFDKVLHCIYKLSADIVKPKDPNFKEVHPRLKSYRFSPYFDNCIGAIDGTHIPVVAPASKVVQHVGRHGYTSRMFLLYVTLT